MKLENTFHNTVCMTRKTREEVDAILNTQPEYRTYAEKLWVRRVARKLCPSAGHGCTCGRNELCER